MLNSNIFNTIQDFAKERFRTSFESVLPLLYGYAKLISMDDGVLDVLFSDEEERRELAGINELMDEQQIDVELLKLAIPFLFRTASPAAETDDFEKILEPLRLDEKSYSSIDVLRMIFKSNIPELALLKKGHTLDDILTYLDQQPEKTLPENNSQKKSSDTSSTPLVHAVVEKDSPDNSTDEKNLDSKRERFGILIDKTEQLYNRLMCRVMGQNEAVRMFAQGYFQSEILHCDDEVRKGPASTFLFAGPPGVGKTFLASTAAELLKLPFLRIDMSEYSMPSAVQKLSGVPKTYNGPKPGVMTDFVDKNPKSIILLDEIEKAHEDVIYLFLQVLDGGILTDSFTDKSISFKDTILIFTTNAGKSLYEGKDRQNLSSIPRSVVLKALEEELDEHGAPRFPAAMCSRFASGNLIMFNYLKIHNLIDIANDKFSAFAKQLNHLYGYQVEFDPNLAPLMLYSQSTGMDARNIASQSSILLKNELYEFGRHIDNWADILPKLSRIRFLVQIPENDSDIISLFVNNETAKILYMGSESDLDGVLFNSKCQIVFAHNREELMDTAVNQDISFVLLDLAYGITDKNSDYLSLDDRRSEGIAAFNEISSKLPQIPIYLLEKEEMDAEDKNTFLERGARGFLSSSNKLDLSDSLAGICDMMYLQKKIDELSSRGRVLSFNTAQRFSENGTTAELIFYDFRPRIAADARENSLLLADNERPKDRFKDVIGAENAKSELQYFINFLKNPKKYMADSVKIPKGILLYGPPGTGKTMLARALAGETEASFFSTTAASFQDKYIGEGERRIRDLFKTAKKFAPSIIFIDEIDAIGKERTGSHTTQHVETLLNTLLTEMDGFEVDLSKPVFVVAATNFDLDGTTSGKAARMDPALIRRFDNRIYVDLPNEKEREKFLNLQITKSGYTGISQDAIHNVAQRTTGQSLAILKNVLELAIRNAGKEGKKPDDNFLLNALEEYMYGEKKEWNETYYKSVSIHESGHAYICSLSGEKPSYVTIVSRGNFGGYMQHSNDEETPSYTRENLLWKIRTSLAGRAAEKVFFGEAEGTNTGIASDLQQATNIAMNMICRYGMIDDYLVSLPVETVLQSPRGDMLLTQVNDLLKQEMLYTEKLVAEGKDKIQALSDFLLKNNQATEGDIIRIFGME